MIRIRRYRRVGFLACLTTLLVWFMAATPSQAHWADLAAAEIWVDEAAAQITLTFPTGLVLFADDDRSGQLSPDEVRRHNPELQAFLNPRIQLISSENQSGVLTVQPSDQGSRSPTVRTSPSSHSTLLLNYAWTRPLQGIRIHYDLFLPGVSTASCLATIQQSGEMKTFVFTPDKQDLALTSGLANVGARGVLLAIVGAFVWGAAHSMTPGHGKTIVGAYLVGERATSKHALALALVTTITHTIGVFALGLVTLFAAQYVLPEQLYPWLSLISGIMVAAIGFNLLKSRLNNHSLWKRLTKGNPQAYRSIENHPIYALPDRVVLHAQPHTHDPAHHHAHEQDHIHHSHNGSDHHYHEDHTHPHSYTDHSHTDHAHKHHVHKHHAHEHHQHSHLPPGADGSPVTWRSILALGISGGLVPCPAALVLLLSTIGLGKVGLGLVLVLAFSLGLAGVLTGLGLTLVYTKKLFQKIPSQLRLIKFLPTMSALGILLLGCGISIKAFSDLGWLQI